MITINQQLDEAESYARAGFLCKAILIRIIRAQIKEP